MLPAGPVRSLRIQFKRSEGELEADGKGGNLRV